MDWIYLAQDGDRRWVRVNAIMNRWFPWNAGNSLTTLGPVSFSGRTLIHGVKLVLLLFCPVSQYSTNVKYSCSSNYHGRCVI
jgi:hypothetical protein